MDVYDTDFRLLAEMRMPESLLLGADNALYKAKREGRNHVAKLRLCLWLLRSGKPTGSIPFCHPNSRSRKGSLIGNSPVYFGAGFRVPFEESHQRIPARHCGPDNHASYASNIATAVAHIA